MASFFLLIAMCIICTSGEGKYSSAQVIDNVLQLRETNEPRIDDSQWIVINRANQSRNKIFTKKDECSRYCIESKDSHFKVQSNQHHKKINFIWHISQDLPEFNKNTSPVNDENPKVKDSNVNQISNEKCEIQLTIGCKNFAIETDEGNTNKMEILRNNDLTNYSSNRFNVNNNADRLQLKILGNVTWIFLEIPTGINRTKPLGLSLVRFNDRNEVNLVANNPPPGGWLLKLKGRENSTYNLTVIQALPVEFSGRFSASPDADNLDQENDNDGIVIFLEDTETIESRQASLKFPGESSYPLENENFARTIVFQESLEELSNLRNEENGNSELRDLTLTSELITRGKSVPVNLAPETSLLVRPGGIHPVTFTVTNNQPFDIIHEFQATSTQFRIWNIQPRGQWIRSDETIKVIVSILVPTIEDNVVNEVSLRVEKLLCGQKLGVIKKSAYTYVQSSLNAVSDSTKPTIDWEFNNNCAGRLRQERCENSFWTVDITVTDSDSGLKRVTSQPGDVHPKREFIAGTKNPVHFLYTSTCCYTTVEIAATDVVGNTYSRTIDVTAWDNLTTGEIAAIVLGSLLLLLIIILLILLCIYCVRKRKSADISYTQRYGSRGGPTSRTEGTNF